MDRFPLHAATNAATNQQGSGDTKSSVLDKHLEGESWGSRFLSLQSWRCRPVWFIAKGAPSQNSSTCWVAFSEVLGCGAAAARNKSEQMAQRKSSESARFAGNHIKLLDTRSEGSHFLRSRHPNSFLWQSWRCHPVWFIARVSAANVYQFCGCFSRSARLRGGGCS